MAVGSGVRRDISEFYGCPGDPVIPQLMVNHKRRHAEADSEIVNLFLINGLPRDDGTQSRCGSQKLCCKGSEAGLDVGRRPGQCSRPVRAEEVTSQRPGEVEQGGLGMCGCQPESQGTIVPGRSNSVDQWKIDLPPANGLVDIGRFLAQELTKSTKRRNRSTIQSELSP